MLDRVFERVARFILVRIRTTAVITLVTMLACIAIIPQIELAEGIESFYERDHPKQAVLDTVEDHFVHGRWLFITYETDDVFSKHALEVVRALSDQIALRTVEAAAGESADLLNSEGKRRAVADVLSLTTVKDIVGSDLSFRNVPLVPEVIPDDPVALRAVRDRALDNHLIRDSLISVDGRHAGIIARMEGSLGEHRSAEVVDEVRALLRESESAHPDVTFVMTGMPVVDRDIPYITKVDTLTFTPVMLVIAAIILFISIRRVRGVALAMFVITLSSVAALAMVPATLSTYNPLCSILLPLVCIQCVSLVLHFLIESGKNLITNPDQDVTHRTLRELLKPVFMCSFSTALGFASLAFTPTTAIAEFGRIMAASLMMAAFLTTMVIALAWKWKGPAAFVSPRGMAVSRRFASWMTRYLQFLERRWQLVAAISIAVLLAFTAGAFRLRVGESDIGYFKESAPARVGATVMEKHLGGATPIIVSIKTNDPDRWLDPVELKKLEKLDAKLREVAAVDRVTSIVDYLKVMNRAFLGLGREGLVIPENREQVAQLLLLNSDDHVREFLDSDRKWVRIVARSSEHETYDLQKMFETLDAYLAAEFPGAQGYDAQVTGEAVVFSLNTDNNTVTQVQGLASAAFTIILLFVILFRSWSVGLYAILPNAFPIAATLGLMGWLGIELSVATSMISSITVGMVVDDTIHFVASYRERVEAHGDVRLAIEESYHVKGPATIFTGVIFTLGFAVFMFAELVPLQHFGLLAACAMFLGALCEITVGPCILLVTRSRLGAHVRPADAVTGFSGTVVDVINGRAAAAATRRALITVLDGDTLEKATTWGELSASGRAIAGALTARGLGGHRVVVFLGDGGADAAILFGVLAAGCVAVPAPAPDASATDAHIARLALLIKSVDARAVLARRELHGLRERLIAVEPSTSTASWMAPEDRSSVVPAGAPLASDPALLVCDHDDPGAAGGQHLVTHAELRAAAEAVKTAMALGPDVTAVAALPLYDPVAIVWTLLAPLVAGADVVVLAQPHVRERPARVLEAIARHRALYAPVTENLLDRCERTIDAAAAAKLRLSTWKMAPVLGAPVRDRVAARFSAALAASGFEGGWLKPAWTPLPVFGAGALSANVGARRRISLKAYREGRVELAGPGELVVEIAAIGTPLGEAAVRVVDPHTGTPCEPGKVGELHIANKPGATERATGDVGVVVDGVVYVLGDARESVRIALARLTPEIVEASVEAEERLVDGRVTAFFVPEGAPTLTRAAAAAGRPPRVVIIAEVDRRRRNATVAGATTSANAHVGELEGFDARVVAERVRDAVKSVHGIVPQAVAIVPLGALPRDALGRVARAESRARFQSGEIDSLTVLEEARVDGQGAGADATERQLGVKGRAVDRTLIDVLRRRADQHGDARVYTFLTDGEEPGATLTFAELDQQVRAVAASLEERLPPGSRAMLLYPPGLDYIVAFYACLSAGVIAVPAYPPDPMRLARTLPRLRAVAGDADPAAVLTTGAIIDFVGEMLGDAPELARLAWIATDEATVAPDGARNSASGKSVARLKHRPRAEDVAFLQYTSGSTSLPKGVIVTHANLMHNLEAIRGVARLSRDSRVVSWLPPYHDMGLIGGVLEGVFAGYDTVLFSPLDFMQRPMRWLNAISRFQATGTTGPNFAFDLCARKATPEERETLDLSTWRTAINGAEPVRAATLERFVEVFGACGFKKNVMTPCYGLAESTLIVSGADEAARPQTLSVLASGLEEHRVVITEAKSPGSRALVGCGRVLGGQDVRIVDPETRIERTGGDVGEIWIRGPSVARGYWRRDDETKAAFGATLLNDDTNSAYLRTGDLGFIRAGEVYVTGRLKDVVIIRGRNHYPHDIELTVERAHESVRPGCVAAFPADIDGEEQLVIVAEVDPDRKGFDVEGDVLPALLRAVGTGHDLRPHAIVLIQPRTIAKTTSGKIQRYATRLAWLRNELQTIAHWTAGAQFGDEVSGEFYALGVDGADRRGVAGGSIVREAPSPTSLREFLVERIARRLRMKPRDVDVTLPLNSLGLDSADALALSGDLESWLGRRISPTVLYEHPTIAKLVDALASVTPQLAGDTSAAHVPVGPESSAIAIVGLACRLPQANDADAFWDLLVAGKNAVREVPPHRWDVDAFYAPAAASGAVPAGKMNTRFMAWLDDIDRFDAGFFGVSPRAAARMDPQQRLLLEVAWQALEDAGISPAALSGTPTGVFVGISTNDYGALQLLLAERDAIDQNTGTGTALSIAANRISYQLDLRGPSMSLDTACSSSLVAVHMACKTLLSGEANTALAGGVNLILLPQATVALSQARMMAADGRCKTFDASADGYVRGEGCGIVVLKRLADAERDGDRVLAVIRGTAVNQDGRSNGLTAPNPQAQVAVIREALKNAHTAPAEVTYVEAHGTGTSLGDPIEVTSLSSVLSEGRAARAPGTAGTCMLGSVKTNIGHLEAAAGVAGLIKVVMSLQHGLIPPHLHLTRVNPRIDLDATPFQIPTSASPWPDGARVAGVSSFGFGGTNAHIVIAAAPTRTRPPVVDPATTAVVLSAKTPRSLAAVAANTARAITANSQRVSLLDAAYTLNAGRARHSLRVSFAAHDAKSLAASLEAFAAHDAAARTAPAGGGRIGFVFSGQGAQKAGMGRALYDSDATFRDTLQECARILERRLERPLLSLLWGPDVERIDDTMFTQPALFAVELALARTWMSWGVMPAVVVGHSIGELVAATVAGACTLEEGLKLVVERGRLMQELPRDGAMVSVAAEEDEVRAALRGMEATVNVSAVNAPGSIVISGVTADVERVANVLTSRGRRATKLAVSHAFHSPLMAPMLDPFERAAAAIDWRPLVIPLASNVSGEVRTAGASVDATYWRRHARDCVRFADNIHAASNDVDVWIEIGPRGTLTALGKRTQPKAAWISSLPTGDEDRAALTVAAASADAAGARVDWEAVYRPWGARRAGMPTYPFERSSYWLAAAPLSPGESGAARFASEHAIAGSAGAQGTKAPRDEMADLAREQQRLLARLGSISDRQRALVDDIAHAPTTPPSDMRPLRDIDEQTDDEIEQVASPVVAPPRTAPATAEDAIELIRNIGRFPIGYVTPPGQLLDLGFDSIMLLELRAFLGGATDTLGLGARVQDVIDLVVTAAPRTTRIIAPPPAGAALEAWMQKHVCIDPPYFALRGVALVDGALRARVTRETALLREVGPMSAAEAGRHMALLGACAVAATSSSPAFQLARRAQFRRVGSAEGACEVTSRVVERTEATARAMSSLIVGGVAVFEADVDYAILSPRAFELAFANDIARANEVRAQEGAPRANPYATPIALSELRVEGGVATAVIPSLPAWACAGHFDVAPAMPVAFLMSCLSALATELLASTSKAAHFVVERADVSAPSLAFAGSRVAFRATVKDNTVTIEANVDGRLVATGSVVMRAAG